MKRSFLSAWIGPWFIVSLAGAIQAWCADWPAFRGPNAAGVADQGQPPIHFGAESNLLWKNDFPRGHSSPVIWKDDLFLTAVEGQRLQTICLDRRNGNKRWEQTLAVEKQEKVHSANSAATPTPVTDGHALYVYFGSFGLLAYDLQGKELWRKSLPLPKTFQNQGTGTSPILAEGKLVLFIQTGPTSHLLWKETKGVPEVPSPLVLDRRVYLVRSGGILVCRDLETGKLIYESRLDSPGAYFASPVAANGCLYFASDRGTVTVVKAGDVFKVLARNQLGDRIMASPAVIGNTLYLRSVKQLWAFGQL